jgi:hypothetical protein
MPDVTTTAGDVGWENAPAHYKGEGGIENFDVWDAYYMDPYTANAFKYLARYDKKGSPVNDLKKALHYIEEIPARLRRDQARVVPAPAISLETVLEAFGLTDDAYVGDAMAYLLLFSCDTRSVSYLEAAKFSINYKIKQLLKEQMETD